jgi:hypothetical protein
MEDGTVDYSKFPLEQLLDVRDHIDGERYPINFANLKREIAKYPAPPPPVVIAEEAEARDVDKLDRDLEYWATREPEGDEFNRLSFIQDAVASLPELKVHRPSVAESRAAFLQRIQTAISLMMSEREMSLFVLLQWAAIAAGYYLWVRGIYAIPSEFWGDPGRSNSDNGANWILLLWSFLCVGIVSLPLGVFSACMGAVAVLRVSGNESTIAAYLRLTVPHAFRLWGFTWIDGWLTVWQIAERLPSRRMPSWKVRLVSESRYYAWKFGSAGVLPALILGRPLVQAGVDSVTLLRYRFREVMLLRVGYSATCWLVGVLAYIGTIVFFRSFPDLIPHYQPIEKSLGDFYFWAGVPILFAVAIVVVFLRPVYLIALCQLYVDERKSRGIPLELPLVQRWVSALILVAIIGVVIVVGYLYRDVLGMGHWIEWLEGVSFQWR